MKLSPKCVYFGCILILLMHLNYFNGFLQNRQIFLKSNLNNLIVSKDRSRDIKHDMLFTNDTSNFKDYENYKNPIFLEGSQVEEEGLKDILRQKIKQSQNAFDSKTVLNRRNDVFKENSDIIHSRFKIRYDKTVINNKKRIIRAATAKRERIWDYGVIPYVIDSNFSALHKALFKRAMRHYENYTCLKFVEREKDVHNNYIVFTEKPCGCCSFVGKRGNGPQAISIGKNCDKFGIIIHELGHVLGFWHEHTRPDRDKHYYLNPFWISCLTSIFKKIQLGQEYNFNKLTEEEVNSLGLPYDYASIMHYADNTFSKGIYLDTIQPNLDEFGHRPEIGQRIRLSKGDIEQTNLLYNCFKCGKTYQTRVGFIDSPSSINSNFHIKDNIVKCEYRITATHGESIILKIRQLDIANTNEQNCSTDFLEIRDGYWKKSKLLQRLCGNMSIDYPIISTSSRMLLTYIAKNAIGHSGFKASYEVICGGYINVTSEWKDLESPNYPDEYLPLKSCIWKLYTNPKYRIALKFQAFELENQDNCMYDYLQIVEGFHDFINTTTNIYCGYRFPPEYLSILNEIQIKFVSDQTVQKAGFSLIYTYEVDECLDKTHKCEQQCINTIGSYICGCNIGFELHSDGKHCEIACGGILNSTNGTIMSPSYPENYPSNKRCEYEIVTNTRNTITLNFTHFDLEGNNIHSDPCEYDRLEIFTRLSNDKLIKHGIFCGSILPHMIMSKSNILKLIFISDNSNQRSGFVANFFTDLDECTDNNGGCQHECHNTLNSYYCSCHNGFVLNDNKRDCTEGNCKYEIRTAFGKITSPNYPDYYQIRKECVWHFSTTPGHRIKLSFYEFDLESHPECYYDHIVIYDGYSPEDRNLGRYCGNKLPPIIFSTSNQMLMVFKSDSSVQLKGFVARHETVCGGRLMATKELKHVYSHVKFGSHPYDNATYCEWILQTYPNLNVRINFILFDLEGDLKTGCKFDYVEVFNDYDSFGKSYGRYCGKIKPKEIISTNDVLRLRFKTDSSNTFKGFSIAYQAIEYFDNFQNK